MPPPKLELVEVTNDHAFLVCGPIACVIWRGTIRRESMMATEALGMRALRKSPGGAGLLFFPEATAPSHELRALSTRINERLTAQGAVGVAGVFLAQGMLATMQRGIVVAMAMISSYSYPLRIFKDTTRACEWLGAELQRRGVDEDTEAIAELIEAFRDEYLTHGARTPVLSIAN